MMKLLRTNDVTELTGLSRTTIWRLERRGSFPRRKRITANAVGWRADEIQQWLENLPEADNTDTHGGQTE